MSDNPGFCQVASQARGGYQAGRRTGPDHPSLMLGAALALLELDRPEEALTFLEPLAVQFPTDAGTLNGLDRARSMLDNTSPR